MINWKVVRQAVNTAVPNLVEKVARDVSGRYDEMLKRNAEFLRKQRLEKKTIEVLGRDGKPGVMHGTPWKSEQ